MSQLKSQEIIGIVGGMGPMSGVLLQKLIIDFTTADTDQKHLPVITFTNPQIPDRTKSLFSPYRGYDFVVAIQETINALVQAGATVIGIPCNTSHARYAEIQKSVLVPIINMVAETTKFITNNKFTKVGILATDGTIQSGVYNLDSPHIEWVYPNTEDQKNVMRIIYEIKAGLPLNKKLLLNTCNNLSLLGADRILLGCTELSLYYTAIAPYFAVIDSLRVLAQSLVNYTTPSNQSAFSPINIDQKLPQRSGQSTVKMR